MSEWTQFRGDERNSGRRDEVSSPPRPDVSWTADLDATPIGSPILDRNAVYAGTEIGIVAVDRHTGDRRWRFDTDAAVHAPIRTGDVVAFVTRDGTVRALDARSGEPRWGVSVPGPVEAPPTADGDLLVVGHAAGVSALAVETGEERWTRRINAPVVGTPAVHDGRVFVGTRDEDVRAFRTAANDSSSSDSRAESDDFAADPAPAPNDDTAADADTLAADTPAADADTPATDADTPATDADDADTDDESIWTAPIDGTVVGGPVVVAPDEAPDRVYVADDDGLMLALDAATGQTWFTYQIRDAFTTAPTVIDDAVFVAAADGYCHVTDTQFGTRKVRGWLFSKKGIGLDGVTTAEPAYAGGRLCLGDDTGSVYGIEVDDLDFAWHRPLEAGASAGPAIGEDGLYVGTDDGRLVRLGWAEDEPGWN
ncbi:PQQ-binding-like beta-propeller repeat protein [Halobacteria archaeon AArc-dxtr1]|nr:PQQ-binding-like beta-propeller repeat protein [Halobacteria archaeon AArc-dxtr1]